MIHTHTRQEVYSLVHIPLVPFLCSILTNTVTPATEKPLRVLLVSVFFKDSLLLNLCVRKQTTKQPTKRKKRLNEKCHG